MTAIRATAPQAALAAFGTSPPGEHPTDLSNLHQSAIFLLELHEELGGLGYTIPHAAALVRALAQSDPELQAETPRWEALAHIASVWSELMNKAGLADHYSEIQRTTTASELGPFDEVYIVGVHQLPPYLRALLGHWRPRTRALVAAPSTMAGRYDELGCVIPSQWADRTINLPEDSIRFAGSPREQANAVLDAIARLGNALTSDEVTVVAGCPETAAGLLARGGHDGVPEFHAAAEASASLSAPARLLHALRSLLQSRAFTDFEAIVRHPDIERWLLSKQPDASTKPGEDWLIELDDFVESHLPPSFPPTREPNGLNVPDQVRPVIEEVERLLADFMPVAPRSLRDWADRIRAVLFEIYAPVKPVALHDPNPTADLHELLGILDAIRAAPAMLLESLMFSAPDALTLVLNSLEDRTVTTPTPRNSIEMVGWLEATFDPARAVIVMGMNEGQVPTARRNHPMLPDGLRARLGLPTTRDDLARDLCVLTQLAASRQHLTLIAARRSINGDPLRPSRLLFACEPEMIPGRVLRFLNPDPQPPDSPIATETGTPPASKTRPPIFEPMPRVPVPQITHMNVTAFKPFLRSPYGFLLEHVLNLRPYDTPESEMNLAAFGTILHRTLHDFASSPEADSANAADIEARLTALFRARIVSTYGHSPLPAIRVQTAHACLRLAAFAHVQADWRAQGWKILHSEWSPQCPAVFAHDSQSITLRGRIDRVDLHEPSGRLAVLDYKTGDGTRGPDPDHRNSGGSWHNLQLPLYRYLAAELSARRGIDPNALSLGYARLGHEPRAIGIELSGWTEQDLASADAAAAAVIRQISRADLFRLGDSPPQQVSLAAICGATLTAPTLPDQEPGLLDELLGEDE